MLWSSGASGARHSMVKNPAEPEDTPEPEGGRAAQRLRDLMLGRFTPANPADAGKTDVECNATSDDTEGDAEPEEADANTAPDEPDGGAQTRHERD